jgi:hypothetical protein
VQDWCEHGATVLADVGVDEVLDLVLPLWQQCESAWPEREELTA